MAEVEKLQFRFQIHFLLLLSLFIFLLFSSYFLLLLSYPTPALENVWAFSRERMMAGYEKLHFL